MKISKTFVAAALAALSIGSASAATNYGSSFATGVHTYDTSLATYTAWDGEKSGTFAKKTWAGATGVGVTGGNSGAEIDVGQSIVAAFKGGAQYVESFVIGLLFDGPEFSDVMEKAKITATFLDGSTVSYFLTAADLTSASWTGDGSVTNLSPATGNTAGVWKISNPFGGKAVKSLVFSAVNGECKTGNSCSSQSDYTLMSVTAVPEAETYAMMLAGLGMVGAIVRRRKKSA